MAAEDQERFFQRRADGAVRIGEYEGLVGVQEGGPAAVKQVQKVADEPEAVEDGELGAAGCSVSGGGVFQDGWAGRAGRYNHIVVNAAVGGRNLGEGSFDIRLCDRAGLHFVDRADPDYRRST